MKPANLRKRGGNSRSVQTLADKVVNTILLAPALQRACFVGKTARAPRSVVILYTHKNEGGHFHAYRFHQ